MERKDTSEREGAEVLRSEDSIRLIIDSLPVMAWTARPDGILDFVSQRWVDYSGLSLEQYVAEPEISIHPEDAPGVMKKWTQQMSLGEDYEGEMRLRRADGEYRWFLVRTSPLRDAQGNILKWCGVATDIEDRKRAEQTLKQSERQMAEAQRLAHVGGWTWDLSTNDVTWSDELYRIFGLPREATKKGGERLQSVHPADRDRVWDLVQRSVSDRQPFSCYYRVIRPDKSERIVHTRGSIVSREPGEPLRAFGFTQDVTELKRAEEALRLFRNLLDQSSDAIEIIDPTTFRFLDCNESAYRSLGYSREEFLSLSVRDIDPHVNEESVAWSAEEIERSGHVVFESVHRRKDGSDFPVEVNLKTIRLEKEYRLAVVRDITERKRAEEQLRALTARLDSAREEEGIRIAREIHDELGGALTTLRWSLESVNQHLSDEPGAAQLKDSTASMLGLIDITINTVRRIASELRPVALDDLGLVEAIEWQARQFEKRTGVVTRCKRPLEGLKLSREQSAAVFRIFQEALTNILRHAGASVVNIEMEVVEGEFVLKITDDGRGIADAEKSGSRALGILGMRERAHIAGARIEITGIKGKGTVVDVRMLIER